MVSALGLCPGSTSGSILQLKCGLSMLVPLLCSKTFFFFFQVFYFCPVIKNKHMIWSLKILSFDWMR